MTTAHAFNLLTTAQAEAVTHVVGGATIEETATRMGIAVISVKRHLQYARVSLICPKRSSTAVLAHAALTRRQVSRPAAPRPGITLDRTEQRLLHAIAKFTSTVHIAVNAGIATHRATYSPPNLEKAITALLDTMGARSKAHAVGIGHTLRILGRGMPNESTEASGPVGASR